MKNNPMMMFVFNFVKKNPSTKRAIAK